MKQLQPMVRKIAIFLVAGLAACASHPTAPVQCPQATITYVGSTAATGSIQGRFQITQRGDAPLRLPLFSADREVHGYAATIWVRDAIEPKWHLFNTNLDEYMPSTARLVVAPGEVEWFLYAGEGAFQPGVMRDGQTFSIVVRDLQGCMHRSLPFVPGVSPSGVDAGARSD